MAYDRRVFMAGVATALIMGCSRPGEGREMASDSFWTAFRNRFLDGSGRIVDNGNGGISHSEGQGYGMLLAARAGDRAAFEAMHAWTERTLARSDMALFSWKYTPEGPNHVPDPNNATDGDILIAWALGEAARRWSVEDWAQRARAIRGAIRANLVVEKGGLHALLPAKDGFYTAGGVILNPSYFIWPALDAFRVADGEGVWGPVIEDAEEILRQARFGPAHLPTDWIEVSGNGQVAPATRYPPRFGFDAVRVPLYAIAGRRASLAETVTDFWRQRQGSGKPVPAWVDVVTGEEAPYALSAGGMAVLRRALGNPPPREALAPDYYAAVLQTLTRALT